MDILPHPISGRLISDAVSCLNDACLRQRSVIRHWPIYAYCPTGSGKTISSIAFALEHARTNNLRRVIYVIPYTSIIDQTVGQFEAIFGTDAVLPHYSEAPYQLKNESDMDETDLRRALAAENWNAPIVVTTAVQFFESLYSNATSRCRKLHNIADSVISSTRRRRCRCRI